MNQAGACIRPRNRPGQVAVEPSWLAFKTPPRGRVLTPGTVSRLARTLLRAARVVASELPARSRAPRVLVPAASSRRRVVRFKLIFRL